jgi:hypothetical protein
LEIKGCFSMISERTSNDCLSARLRF